MKTHARWMALAAVLALGACETVPPPPPPPPADAPVVLPGFLAVALSDPARPEADRARDATRHPGEVLLFAGLRPGMKVVDLVPGGGYFTRILSRAVGPSGRVYAYVPDELTALAKGRPPSVAAFVGKPPYGNSRMILQTLPAFGAPEKVDMVFTAQNYHDMHLDFMGPADLSVVNRRVFAALKPGGVYIVIDHSAKPGSGLRDSESLHRIDAALVRREVEAAGFVFDGESRVLSNPRDPLTANVFDPSIRGRTDQFVYRFRKPRSAR
ncbi:MAG TPA: class I SAM-dependent methyltransferase [Caulobacter sp.]|nr:class I SAM-dependent methyltransferase [Caulobacter sp.]